MLDVRADWAWQFERLKSDFLSPGAGDLSGLLSQIEAFAHAVGLDGDDRPYLGQLFSDYRELAAFEQIPPAGLSIDECFAGLASATSGALRWNHPNVMHNIIPSPLTASVAVSAVANLLNLNAIWDFIGAGSQAVEAQVARQLAVLAGWHPDKAGGVSTFGGKGCITYAIRIGLSRCLRAVASEGLASRDGAAPVVITSRENHYCIETAASLVGIGKSNVWRAAVRADETIVVEDCRRLIVEALSQGRPIAAIILCGGNSLHLSIDALREVKALRDELVAEYKLDYTPFLYFDTCIGWPWLFFRDYDFALDPMQIEEPLKSRIQKGYTRVSEVEVADGFSVDFHKNGLCPYATSFFVCKDKAELHSLAEDDPRQLDARPPGNNFMHSYTIEHSRSAAPIFSAWLSVQRLGRSGYQSYICHLLRSGDGLRDSMSQSGFELLNDFSLTQASVWFPLRPGSPKRYWDVLEESEENVRRANRYTHGLFHFLCGELGGPAFVFRYVPQYRSATSGENLGVLVAYPMSPFSSYKDNLTLGNQISSKKEAFDKIYAECSESKFIPKHVIK